MRFQESLEKIILTDKKRSVCTTALFTCFWRLLSKDVTLGMAIAICDQEAKANKMAEKPN